ncbi:unnamed protein product [Polarella glacialis]|uniref:Uncharacterized protein n=1 Tax=Polarella glacialis TaxID=89957 RepID=A0A813HXP1_POLGL|nr:unnamed protein product [Polarella glacialis]
MKHQQAEPARNDDELRITVCASWLSPVGKTKTTTKQQQQQQQQRQQQQRQQRTQQQRNKTTTKTRTKQEQNNNNNDNSTNNNTTTKLRSGPCNIERLEPEMRCCLQLNCKKFETVRVKCDCCPVVRFAGDLKHNNNNDSNRGEKQNQQDGNRTRQDKNNNTQTGQTKKEKQGETRHAGRTAEYRLDC